MHIHMCAVCDFFFLIFFAYTHVRVWISVVFFSSIFITIIFFFNFYARLVYYVCEYYMMIIIIATIRYVLLLNRNNAATDGVMKLGRV